MIIAPITKDYFFKVCSGCTSFRRVDNVCLSSDLFPHFSDNSVYYCEKPGEGVFVYFEAFRKIFIPDIFPNLTIDNIDSIDMSQWKLEKIGEHDPRYTKNVAARTRLYHYFSTEEISEFKKLNLNRKKFLLSNDHVGYRKEIEFFETITEWSYSLDALFEEKLELPFNKSEVDRKTEEIFNILLWMQKKQ